MTRKQNVQNLYNKRHKMMINDVSAKTHNLSLKNRMRLNRHEFFRCRVMLSSLFDPADLTCFRQASRNRLEPGCRRNLSCLVSAR